MWVLACLVALLVVEVVGLSIRFDFERAGGGRWGLAGRAHHVPRLAAATALAVLLLGGERLARDARRFAAGCRRPGRVWAGLLAAHLAGLAVFTSVTARVAEGSGEAGASWALPCAWGVAGVGVLGLWGATAARAVIWARLVCRQAGPVAGGLAVGVAAWGAGLLTEALWGSLHRSTFWVVHGLLGRLTAATVCRPEDFVVGTKAFCIRIEPGCSGYEGLGLVLVFLSTYLWVFRRSLKFPQVFLLYPLGMAAIWLSNALRIVGLVVVGTWWSPAAARGGFHSQAGWLAFNAVALCLVVTAQRSRVFSATAHPPQGVTGPEPSVAYLAPMTAVLAASMASGLFVGGFDGAYPVRVVAAAAALWVCRSRYAGPPRPWSWQALALGVAAFALWMALEQTPFRSPASAEIAAGLARLPRGLALVWVACRVLGSVVTVPIVEELAFRGYLIRRLVSVDFLRVPLDRVPWPAVIVSSAVFGVLHGRWLAGGLTGVLFALAARRRGSVAEAALAHAVTNGLIAAYVLVTGSWDLWS